MMWNLFVPFYLKKEVGADGGEMDEHLEHCKECAQRSMFYGTAFCKGDDRKGHSDKSSLHHLLLKLMSASRC